MFHFSSGYNSIDLDSEKVGIYSFGVTFMTPWKVYLDMDINYGGGAEESDTYSLGNTEMSIGATWLQFGSLYDQISVDVVGGISLGVKDSAIGSQRDDSYIGLLTKKNFGHSDLTLGFEHWFMDDEVFASEKSVGGFNNYLVNLGWSATSDIRFDFSFQFINLSEIENFDDISYTEITPKISLGLSPNFSLILGSSFTSQKDVTPSELEALKVWNISSLYGNSYFTNLNFKF